MEGSSYWRNKGIGKKWTIELPKGKTIVGNKCIFTIKYRFDETIEQYKACLITKRFIQIYRIEYNETFVLVDKLNTIGFSYH